VKSVFGGPPDRARYLAETGGFKQKPLTMKTHETPATRELGKLYARVRKARESGKPSESELKAVHAEVEKNHPDDWLLRLELLELSAGKASWDKDARARLKAIAARGPVERELIERGLKLL
jgi:phenylalanine-4-hydroxylase